MLGIDVCQRKVNAKRFAALFEITLDKLRICPSKLQTWEETFSTRVIGVGSINGRYRAMDFRVTLPPGVVDLQQEKMDLERQIRQLDEEDLYLEEQFYLVLREIQGILTGEQGDSTSPSSDD